MAPLTDDELDDEWDRDAYPGQWYCELCDCYHDSGEGCPLEDGD